MKRIPSFFLSLWCLVANVSFAQDDALRYEIDQILFVGNNTFDDSDLRSLLQSRETPGWFWQGLYSISENLGEKAEYFDPVAFETDLAVLKSYYEDRGFFHTAIDTTIRFDDDARRVTLMLMIQEGARSHIDTLRYEGLTGLPGELLDEIQTKRLLEVGDPFLKQQISDEVRRTLSAFLNYGYVNVQVDRPQALRYASTNNMTVVFSYTPGNRYHFGRIEVQHDTTVDERVETEVILRHLDFASGDFYSEGKKIESERNLNRLGVFERVQIEHLLSELPDTTSDLPMRVSVRPRSFHELSPELGVNDEKNAFNLQFGIGYNNRNFFGGARNLSTRLRVSLQSIQDVDFGRVFGSTGLKDTSLISTVELSTQMVQPYFITNKVSLIWTVSASVEKEKVYFVPILRNRIGFNWQQATYTRVFIDWNLDRISFSPLVTGVPFDTSRFTLDRSPQFNSVLTLTMQRDKRNDLFSPSGGFFHSGSIEESGFLPSITGGLFGTDLPYSKYVKFSAVGQWYWDPGSVRSLIWAFRVRGGFAELYGNSPAPVPIHRRFFAGGSSSVRGWKARALGAESIKEPSEGGTALLEASLEARWHLFKNFGRLWFLELPKLSMVFFYDAGNVWADIGKMSVREVAMAAGFGIRFDTIAGPLRIDYGFRTYDPSAAAGQRWITDRRFFPETFSSGVIHFGVGHSF